MKSRNFFLLGLMLLLFVALILRQNEQRQRRAAEASLLAPAGESTASGNRFFQPAGTARNASQARSSVPQQTSALTSLSDDQDYPFRVRNSSKPLKALFASETAVLLRNALIETREDGQLNIPEHLRSHGDPGSYIVQARGLVDNRFREALRGAGVEIVSYIPNNAYLVRANAMLARQLRMSSVVYSVLPYEPFYKLDMQLLPLAVRQESMPEGRWLNVVLYRDQVMQAKAELSALGAEVKSEQPFPFGHVVTIAPPADSLVALAQMPAVQNIEAYHAPLLMNDLSRVRLDVSVGATNATTTNGNWLGLSGSQVTIGLPDSGLDQSHSELAGQSFLNGSSPTAATCPGSVVLDTIGHGTHLAGSMVAKGVTTPSSIFGSLNGASQRGIAHGAKVYPLSLYDINYTNYGNFWIVTNMATATNIHIVNVSWGSAVSTYTIDSANMDAWVRDSDPSRTNDQPMTYVVAAGNNGGANSGGTGGRADSIAAPGNAKNVITVGALEQLRLVADSTNKVATTTNDPIAVAHTDSDTQVADYSGRGNVGVGIEGYSGRFKPDLVAPGSYVLSLRSTAFAASNITESDVTLGAGAPSTYWRYASGTSIAASKVSGVLALIEEYFRVNYNMTNGLNPSLNKALLINRAGLASSVYDYSVNNPISHQGWGIPSLSNTVPTTTAFAFLTNAGPASAQIVVVDESAFVTNHLASGQYHAFDVTVPAGVVTNTNSLRITLAWTDPPGNPVGSTKLVNDLDLFVAFTNSAPAVGATNLYEGNNFAPGSTITQPTPVGSQSQRDSVNNVENVFISGMAGATAGNNTFRVYVIGRKVNVNAVSANTNNIVQDYTLVISTDSTNTVSVVPVAAPNFATYTNRPIANITNGIPYLEQRIGANSPFAYGAGALANTNGTTNQWNFYVFTNQNYASATATNMVTNILAGVTNIVTNVVKLPLTNGGPFVTFATFLPPNLARARNREADIDLYVTRSSLAYPGSGYTGLTNLDPAVINSPNTLRSTNRGGYETISLSNSFAGPPGEIFYIGVKSEDQQGGSYGFFASASQSPFTTNSTNGQLVITLTPAPLDIPDGSPEQPGGVMLIGVNVTNLLIQSADPRIQYVHENLGDLVGTITHNGVSVTLNNHTITPSATFPAASGLQTNLMLFDSFRSPPDGPGDVTDFLGMDSVGLWILEVYDNSPGLTGRVDAASVFITPYTNSPPTNATTIIRTFTLQAGQSYLDFINIPVYATNLTVDITGSLPAGPVPAGQGIDLFAGYLFVPAQSNYSMATLNIDSTTPHPSMTISPTTAPPLTPGRWNFRVVNNTASTISLTLTYTLNFNLATASEQLYLTNPLVSLADNYTTNAFISIPDDRVIAGVEVGLSIYHPRVEDLSFHLISPSGTRVLLVENRGGTNGLAPGVTPNVYTTNIFANFTENTNRTTSVDTNGLQAGGFLHYDYLLPVKFVPAPFSAAISPPRLMTNMTNTIFGYAGNFFTAVNESPRALAQLGSFMVMAGAVNRNGTNDGFLAAYQTPITNNSGTTNWAVTNYWMGSPTAYRGTAPGSTNAEQTYFSAVALNTDGVLAAGRTRNYTPPSRFTWSGTNTTMTYDVDLGCTNGSVTLAHITGTIHDRIRIEYEGRTLADFTPAGAAAVSFLTNVTFNGASHFMRVTMNPGNAGAVGSSWTNTLNVYRSNGVEYAVSTFTRGSAAVTPTSLSTPGGVALDSSNNVYVADTGNNRILKFAQVLTIPDFLASGISSTNGIDVPLTLANAPFPSPQDALVSPKAVAIGPDGSIFVADAGNNMIKQFTSSGAYSNAWGDGAGGGTSGNEDSGVGGYANGRFNNPQALAVGTNGIVYVADTGNDLIRQIDPVGNTVTTIAIPAAFGTLNSPRGIAVRTTADPAMVSGFNSNNMALFGTSFSSGTNLYISDTLNHRIVWLQRSNATWAAIHMAGSTAAVNGLVDGTNSAALLNQPTGITMDGAGNLYFAQPAHLRKMTPLGAVQTIVGNSSGYVDSDFGAAVQIDHPRGMVADSFGTVFFADANNNAVRTITPYQSSLPTNSFAMLVPITGVTKGAVANSAVTYVRGLTNSVFGVELAGYPSRDAINGAVSSAENGTNFYYVIGSAQFSTNNTAGLDQYDRLFVNKLSTNGQVIWQRPYLEAAVIHAETNGLGAITNLVLDYSGSGYSATPVVTILDPLNPVLANQAIAVSVTVAGGAVTGITAPAVAGLTGPFIAPRVYVEAPTSLHMPGTAVAVAYGTNVLAAGFTNSSALPLTTNNFPTLLSLDPTNGTVLWATNSSQSGHYNGVAVSASGILAVGGAYVAGNTLQSSNLIEKWSFNGTQILSSVYGFGVGTTSVLNGVVVLDSIDRAYAVGSVTNANNTVDAVLVEIDLTTLAVLSTTNCNLTNFAGSITPPTNAVNLGQAITTDGVDIYVSVEGPGPGNPTDRQAGIFRFRAKNFYLPEESLDAFVGERTWATGSVATNSSGTLTNVTVTNKLWRLEVVDSRAGGTNGVAQIHSWNLNFSYAASNVTSLPIVATASNNFVLNSAGKKFVVNVPVNVSQATNFISASAPVKVTVNPTGAPVPGAAGNVVVFTGTSGSFVLSSAVGSAARLRPGAQYYFSVEPLNGASGVNLSVQVNFNQLAAPGAVTLTNGVGFAGFLPRTATLNYYQFNVPAGASAALFELLNLNGDVNLYLSRSNGANFPPTPSQYDYRSANFGSANEQIFLVTNALSPTALTPGTWLLGVQNADNSPVNYTVRASVLTASPYTTVTVASGQLAAGVTPPGNAPNQLFRLPVTTAQKSLLFEVRNLNGAGDLVVRRGTFPLATTYDTLNTRGGTHAQLLSVRTNGALPSLVGDWYFGVLNRGETHLSYNVMARQPTNGVLLGTSPIQIQHLPDRSALSGAGFTFDLDVVPGEKYQVQYLTNLASTNWIVLTNIVAPPGGLINFLHSGALTNRNLYYRIQVVP